MDRVVFLDRDGTINTEVHYLYRPEDMRLLPGAVEGIRRLRQAGFKIVVVTNQAGVARGYYREEDVRRLHRYMNEVLKEKGTFVDQFFYCPHHPRAGIGEYRRECQCRKPSPGLLEMAEQYYEVDKLHSYMVGDKLADTEAGRRYGVATVLVGTGYGAKLHEEQKTLGGPYPYDYFAQSLTQAAEWMIGRESIKTKDYEER